MTLEDDLRALEAKTLASTQASVYFQAVEELRRRIATGDLVGARNLVLRLAVPLLEGVALAAISEAVGVGRDSALGQLARGVTRSASATDAVVPSSAARASVIGIDTIAAELVLKAQRLAAIDAEADAFAAPVYAAANTIAGRVTEGVVRAGNEGVRAVAATQDLPVVWVAETNACVHCLAYSGRVVTHGKFPAGLTYAARSYFDTPLAEPPLHPHCRCILEVLGDQSYADALRREADRSVLRGFSLESESMKVRIDAAARLLDRGVVAPKSVKEYAANAVKRGSFPTRGRSAR